MAGFFGRLFGTEKKTHEATDAKELFKSMITFATRALLKGNNRAAVQAMLIRKFRSQSVTPEQADMAIAAARQVADDLSEQGADTLADDSRARIRLEVKERVAKASVPYPPGMTTQDAEAIAYTQVLLGLKAISDKEDHIQELVVTYGLTEERARFHVEHLLR
jgi:hypothetical protein